MTKHVHHSGCGCLAALSRRAMIGGMAAAALAAPRLASADHAAVYDAMLIKCIDPRFTTPSWSYMKDRRLENLYSEFVMAGGPVGAVAPAFEAWRKTWWDNLRISVGLHHITRVIGICHRDCGAATVAYGDRIKTDRDFETARLSEALRAFRDEVAKHQAQLAVELGIMELNGTVVPVT